MANKNEGVRKYYDGNSYLSTCRSNCSDGCCNLRLVLRSFQKINHQKSNRPSPRYVVANLIQ